MTVVPATEWPRERAERLDAVHPTRRRDERLRAEVSAALAQVDASSPAVTAISLWLRDRAAAGSRLPDVDDLGTALSEALRLSDLPGEARAFAGRDDADDSLVSDVTPLQAALVARAAIHLLLEACDGAAWDVLETVRRVGDRTWFAVASCLDGAVADPVTRPLVLGLAASLVSRTIDDPSTLVPAGDRERLAMMFDAWRREGKLLEIWFGVRDLGFVAHVGGGLSILEDLARREPRFVVDQLARFDVPHPVFAVLDGTGAQDRFETWASLTREAPTAFETDGRWAGATMLPSLLVLAERACREVRAMSRSETPVEVDRATSSMGEVALAAAEVVRGRTDGRAASFRWTAWLLRSFMSVSMETGGDPALPRHPGFPQWTLVTALADGSHGDWDSLSTPDDDSESWFGLMAKVLAAAREPSPKPALTALWIRFAADWPTLGDDPEEWLGPKGDRLRAVSSVVRTFSRRLNGAGVGVLAFPLAATEDPAAEWSILWRRCLVIREQVEFAQVGRTASGDDDPTAGGELLRLAFDVGLSALDRLLESGGDPTGSDGVAGKLLSELWDGSREMAAIDRFGLDVWAVAQRHLVVRRAAFSDDGRLAADRRRFPASTEPTLARMLRALAGVDQGFFATLRSILDNAVPSEMLVASLDEAVLDLPGLLDQAERANVVDDRRPVVGADTLARLRVLR